MKTSIYGIMAYASDTGYTGSWPVPPEYCDESLSARNYRDGIEQIQLAEDLGFDWVSFSEHHYYTLSMSGTPMILGAYLGSHLKRLKIAMLGPHMPLNNPIRVAEELAMLDNLTDGRLIVGLLRGTPNEYQVYSVNPEETRARTMEGMELVMKAWTEPQPFGWEGRYYSYRTVSVWPRPIQRPLPPMYVLGNSAETCDFAARNHTGMGVSFSTFAINGRSTAYYRERCAEYGWQPKPEQIIYRGRIYVAETDEQAFAEADRLWGREGSNPRAPERIATTVRTLDPNPFHTGGAPLPGRTDQLAEPFAVAGNAAGMNFIGSPDTIVKQVQQCKEETGAGLIDLWFQGPALPHEKVMRSIELFGRQVLPRIQDL